jgi:glycosyltransferase involved in cell wall biosynthesis
MPSNLVPTDLKEPSNSVFEIVHIIYSGMGGHYSVTTSLVSGGFFKTSNHIIYFFGTETVPSSTVAEVKSSGIQFLAYVFKSSFASKLKAVLTLLRDLLAMRPDVVICNSSAALPSALCYKFLARSTTVIFRDNIPNNKKRKQDWCSLYLALKFCSGIIFLTLKSKIDANSKFPTLVGSNSTIISNGVDTSYYSPKLTSDSERSVSVLGIAARLEESKGHHILLQAVQILKVRGLEIALEIAGEGSLKAYLEDRVEQLGLTKVVSFLGMLNKQQLLAFYRSLQIYVHPSLSENQSNAVIQAMSVGLPTIGFRVAGVEDVLINNSGILVQQYNASALANSLHYMINNSDIRAQLGKNARRTAFDTYSNFTMAKKYQDLVLSCRQTGLH